MNQSPGLHRWQPLADGVLWLKYWWGPASANALAFRQGDGAWAVVSPPKDAPAAVYDALATEGCIATLVAPNAYHNLGQTAWRARFPEAVSVAPRDALPRLAKKTPDIACVPLETAGARLAPAACLVPPGMKTPDALLRLPTPHGWLWWLGDRFSNNGRSDQTWPFRLLSRVLAGGPGFACNPRLEMVYVADRLAWARAIDDGLRANPPAIILCAHGDPVLEQPSERALASLVGVAKRSG